MKKFYNIFDRIVQNCDCAEFELKLIKCISEEYNLVYNMGIDYIKYLISILDKYNAKDKKVLIDCIVDSIGICGYSYDYYSRELGIDYKKVFEDYIQCLILKNYIDNADIASINGLVDLNVPSQYVYCYCAEQMTEKMCVELFSGFTFTYIGNDETIRRIIEKAEQLKKWRIREYLLVSMYVATHPQYSEKMKGLDLLNNYLYDDVVADWHCTNDKMKCLSAEETKMFNRIKDALNKGNAKDTEMMYDIFKEFMGEKYDFIEYLIQNTYSL